GRRDRRRRGGEGGRVHRGRGDEARGRLHRRLHGAAREDDGPRRRDHLRVVGHSSGEEGRAGGPRRTGRDDPDRGCRARCRDCRRTSLGNKRFIGTYFLAHPPSAVTTAAANTRGRHYAIHLGGGRRRAARERDHRFGG